MIILARISRTLDEVQPVEQAEFRQGFSCVDHIQTVSRIIEVCREYRIPFVLTFFGYEKAFDSVETAILSALVDQEVNPSNVRTLADCNRNCFTTVHLFHRPLNIPVSQGVGQGDTVPPKLYAAALQWVMKLLDWNERGIRVDERIPSNLRFADDIVLFSRNITEAETIITEAETMLKELGSREADRTANQPEEDSVHEECLLREKGRADRIANQPEEDSVHEEHFLQN
ncbi:unnamed protein product [Strongylus vulgaris]|uniref:Reverse transcriptase domain-containing protein n=1 Tax=Strongylus vulgaris TaxID=40348 RepID=A0A3P7L9T3_STRVU|nr:unnamed protein product [Strongylus vulgaris]